MRLVQAFAYLALAVSTVNAVSVPEVNALQLAENARVSRDEILSPDRALEKRKGGGGRGGGGGGGGGRSGGGSGGSSRTSPSSTSGGRTSSGSGPPPRYGGGYYGGGAAVPYKSGGRTPGGLAPGLLLAPAAVFLLMPGIWLYSVYPYYYSNPYRFRNATRNATETDNDRRKRQEVGVEQEIPVVCLCQEFSVCGCEENEDPAYLNDLVGNGSYAALNKTLVTVSDVNGTETLVINGTLPNGTTAPGGEDDSAAADLNIPRYAGYWVMVSIVLSIVTLL